MTLFSIAYSNVRHQARNYAGFFASSALAVWIFFLYAALLHHPVSNGESASAFVRDFLTFAQYVVGMVSALIILQAHAAFMKVRQRDLGVLALVGMRPTQVALMVHWENALVGGAALGVGMGLGAAFLKFFFLILSWAIELPAPLAFHLTTNTLAMTVATFASIFALVSMYDQVILWRRSVAQLIRQSAAQPPPLRVSYVRVGLCLAALGASQLLIATAQTASDFEARVLWIFGVMLVGTYFLFTEGTTALLQVAKRHRAAHYRGVNLIILSQLLTRAKENARLLFTATVLIAGVMVVMGMLVTYHQGALADASSSFPVNVMLVGDYGRVDANRINAVLAQHDVSIKAELHVTAATATSNDLVGLDPYEAIPSNTFLVMRLSDFNSWLTEMVDLPPIDLQPQTAMMVYRWAPDPWARPVTLRIATTVISLQMASAQHYGVPLTLFNSFPKANRVAVVEDALFDALPLPADYRVVLHGYALDDWRGSGPALDQLDREMGFSVRTLKADWEQNSPIRSTLRGYQVIYQGAALILALGVAIAVFFYLAAGNMLYFKLFTDLIRERSQFQTLFKLGVDEPRINRVVSRQTAILFFAPLPVAVLHSAPMMALLARSYNTPLPDPAVHAGVTMLVVIPGAVLLHAGYYLLTRLTYLRATQIE